MIDPLSESEAPPSLRAGPPPAITVPEHIPGEATSERALRLLVKAALLLILCGASVGSAIALFANWEALPGLLKSNILTPELRRQVLYTAGSGSAVGLLGAVALLAARPTARQVALLERRSRAFSPLLVTFALPLLLNWHAFAGKELLFALCAALFGIALERLLWVSFRAQQPDLSQLGSLAARFPRLAERLPLGIVLLLAVFFSGYFSYFTIINHYRVQTASWDLAIFDNMMWNLIRGEWFRASPDLGRTGSHIQYHATFIAYLLGPFYALKQQAETLLVIQGTLVGSTCIPVYLFTHARTKNRWLALVLALAYCLHAPQHDPLFYDFHVLTIAPFFVGWVLYFYETERLRWLIISWLLAILVREDQSACLAMAGFFFLLSGKRPLWAFWGGTLSIVYFLSVKFWLMPLHRSAADKETFAWIFNHLIPAGGRGFGGVLQTLGSNPLFVFDSLLKPEKLTYLLRMFGPVLLLPLRSGRSWVMFAPVIIFTLFSTGYKPLYQTYFQYTSNWISYLFFATAVAFSQLARLPGGALRVASTAMALVTSVFIYTYNHGAVLGRENFRGGFRQVKFERTEQDRRRYDNLRALIAEIPANVSVAATETEAPHVSNREDCFTMRFGHDDADYLLLSIAEARRGRTRAHFKKAIATGNYGFIRRRGGFMLWKKGAGQDRNSSGLRLIGPEPKKSKEKKKPLSRK